MALYQLEACRFVFFPRLLFEIKVWSKGLLLLEVPRPSGFQDIGGISHPHLIVYIKFSKEQLREKVPSSSFDGHVASKSKFGCWIWYQMTAFDCYTETNWNLWSFLLHFEWRMSNAHSHRGLCGLSPALQPVAVPRVAHLQQLAWAPQSLQPHTSPVNWHLA